MRKTRNGNKMHCGQPSGTYVLDYDGFGRLRDGWHYLYGNPVNEWSERNITYDRNGTSWYEYDICGNVTGDAARSGRTYRWNSILTSTSVPVSTTL